LFERLIERWRIMRW